MGYPSGLPSLNLNKSALVSAGTEEGAMPPPVPLGFPHPKPAHRCVIHRFIILFLLLASLLVCWHFFSVHLLDPASSSGRSWSSGFWLISLTGVGDGWQWVALGCGGDGACACQGTAASWLPQLSPHHVAAITFEGKKCRHLYHATAPWHMPPVP